MSGRWWWALGLGLVGAVGCSSDFAPASRVTGLRVLAAQVTPAFARPGEAVQIRALAVDGRGAPFSLAWALCLSPTSGTPTGCLDDLRPGPGGQPPSRLIPGATGAELAVTVPADALDAFAPEARPAAAIGAIVVACPGAIAQRSGPEGLPVRCSGPAGQPLALGAYDVGVKRIPVRTKDRNENPEIQSILWDGQPWPEGEVREATACGSATEEIFDDCSGEEHALALVPTPASFESGTEESGAPFAERLIAQYYATEGLFSAEVRAADDPATRYKARQGAAAVSLWFVLRDDRGGVSWTTRQLRVRE